MALPFRKQAALAGILHAVQAMRPIRSHYFRLNAYIDIPPENLLHASMKSFGGILVGIYWGVYILKRAIFHGNMR